MFLPVHAIVREIFCAGERETSDANLFVVLLCNEKGSGSLFQGGYLERGSESLFRGDVTKLASGACFEVCRGRKLAD
jgi:hypothetical protein